MSELFLKSVQVGSWSFLLFFNVSHGPNHDWFETLLSILFEAIWFKDTLFLTISTWGKGSYWTKLWQSQGRTFIKPGVRRWYLFWSAHMKSKRQLYLSSIWVISGLLSPMRFANVHITLLMTASSHGSCDIAMLSTLKRSYFSWSMYVDTSNVSLEKFRKIQVISI